MHQLKLHEKKTMHGNYFLELEQQSNYADVFGKMLRESASKANHNPPKVLSLFSGAGGLDIGFHDAGFDIVEAIEIESAFVKTLRANSGHGEYFDDGLHVICADIREYHPAFKHIDFIIGGPPCQPFSAAGARAEGVAGTKDDRGKLFLEYVRLLHTLKPKGFLFENVYRITGANKGKDWGVIKEAFSNAGYAISFRVLDSADFGVPQHRERLIIVGLRMDTLPSTPFLFPRPTHGPESFLSVPHFASQTALLGLSNAEYAEGISGKYGHLLEEIPPGLNYSFFTEKMGHPRPLFAWRSKFSDFLYKADPTKPVRTIKAQGGQYTGPFHWNNRPFSIDELKRLQTFPDKYKLIGNRGTVIKQLGNSVPPQFARILALAVLEQVFEYNTPVKLEYLAFSDELGFRKRRRSLTAEYKKKAHSSMKETDCSHSGSILSEAFIFSIDDKFCYSLQKNGDFSAEIFDENDSLYIDIKETPTSTADSIQFEIDITPNDKWILKYKNVVLRSYSRSINSYLALWKTFDYLLCKNNIKADIVQLCGYYQYAPLFSQTLTTHDNYIFNDINNKLMLESVFSGKIVRKTLSLKKMSELIKMPEKMVLLQLNTLKNIGYEVRSSGTNLSLAQHSYLIPYAFPTLTPMSVQLNKRI